MSTTNVYDITNNCHSDIANIAATVGIDWDATRELLDYPCKLNSSQVKTLDKRHKNKCGVITEIKTDKSGREYPHIVFRTFKGGSYHESWSGYDAVREAEKGGYVSKFSPEEAKQRAAQREVKQEAIRAIDRKDNLTNRERSLKWWANMKPVTSSAYLTNKLIPDALSLLEFRRGKDKNGAFIAYPLIDIESGDQVGFERIYDKGGKKVSAGAGNETLYCGWINGHQDVIYVTEGMADAVTIHKATGATVLIAISASNIGKIIKNLNDSDSGHNAIAAIDNDKAGHGSVNLNIEHGSFKAVSPVSLGDYNDVLVSNGLEAVKAQLFYVVHSQQIEHNKYSLSKVESGFINLLIGEKGTGKTTSIKSYMRTVDPSLSVLVVTHRRSLNTQLSNDLKFDNYEEVKEAYGKSGLKNSHRLVCSPESLPSIGDARKYDIVIIDEVEQVFQHISKSKTLDGNNKTSFSLLAMHCNRAKTVILSDANLGANAKALIDMINTNNNKRINKLVNTFRPRIEQKARVFIYETKNEVLAHAAIDERSAYCFSDQKATTEEFDKVRSHHGPSLLVTSRTINGVTTELDNINKVISGYRTFSGSPSVSTGFSVDEGHGFSVGYGHFSGFTATVEQCCQQMARFRGVSEFHISVCNRHANLPDTAEKVQAAIIDTPMAYTQGMLDYGLEGGFVIDDFAKMYCTVEAGINRSKNNFLPEKIKALEFEGFEVIIVKKDEGAGEAVKDDIKDLTETRKADKVTALAVKASDFAIEHNVSATDAEYITSQDDSKKLLTRGLRNAKICRMDSRAAKRDDIAQLDAIKNGELSVVEMTHYSASAKLLKRLCKAAGVDLATFTGSGKTWDKSNEKAIKKFMVDTNKEHYSFLKITITAENKKHPIRWFNNTLSMLGLKVEMVDRSAENKVYTVSDKSLEMLKLLIEDKKF